MKDEVQERFEALKQRKTPQNKKGKVIEEEPQMDPEVAEMMGFGGFGSFKKS